MGVVKYMFEVHVGGSIDSLLMNLSKAVSDASVQKVVAVSHAKALEKIRSEAALLKYLHDKIIYWEVDDLRRVAELTEELNSIMQKLGLIKFG
ncbi:MAG: hypothetical protein N3H84_05035 [Candidatus Caldarchaeum sp.]|nr:hypothetical protein [Candidatus Caldarchaeum sp.]